MAEKAYIIAAKRTPVVPRNGALSNLSIHDLASPVVQACLSYAGLKANDVDELICGNALGAGGNPARLIALASGLPDRVAGLSSDTQCASGLDAIGLAETMIKSGTADVVIAGGAESYSRRPQRLQTFADGRPSEAYDKPPFSPWPKRDPDLAVAADQLTQDLNLTQKEQEAWVLESHRKALIAKERLKQEIVCLQELDYDTFARPLNEMLYRRAPKIYNTVSTANTSVAADGAAFCLVVSETVAKRLSCPSLPILTTSRSGGKPETPGLAPIKTTQKALQQANCTVHDIVRAEIMEAYASQALACVRGLGISESCVNVGGGSLARGHPIGASGAVLAVRLWHELQNFTNQNKPIVGIATIAAAGGLASTLVLSNKC